MRLLFTIVIAAFSLNAFSQGIPQLPYNPDENGDGLIGVPDLQALLAQYGLEFNSAVLSEDAQSAIVYMGEMAHPVCSQACDNLPGFWHMSTMADLGLVWGAVDGNISTWVNHDKETFSSDQRIYDYTYLYGGLHKNSQIPVSIKGCYCAAHELPKVEYKKIIGMSEENVTDLGSEGWKLLEGATVSPSGVNYAIYGVMWRWAVE